MLFESIAELQSDIELRTRYTGGMGYSLMATVEGDATSGLASLPSSFSQLVGTLGDDVTDDDLLGAVRYLDNGDVPQANRFLYGSPGLRVSLLKLDKFTRQDYVGQGDAEMAVKRARVGMVYGAPVFISTLANNNPSSAGTSYGWFCHKEGVALIIQQKPVSHAQWILLSDGWGVLTSLVYQFVERLLPPSTIGGGSSDDRFNVGVRAN